VEIRVLSKGEFGKREEAELDKILERTTAGDPMSALRWNNPSTPAIAVELTLQGHPVSDQTVARCLRQMGIRGS
jgi:hypothetical protein